MTAHWSPTIKPVSTGDDPAEDDLLARARHDPEAFARAFVHYRPELERYFISRTAGNLALAEDLTSQVFTRAWAALDRYRPGSPRGWLYQIARNLLIDHARKRQADRLDPETNLVAAGPPLDDIVIAQEARDQLHAAISHLTEPQRSIILLRLQGHRSREIALQLGMGHEAVKSAQYRAMARLKTELAHLYQRDDQ